MRAFAAALLAAGALAACTRSPAAAAVPPPRPGPQSAACTDAARKAPRCAGIAGLRCDGGLTCIDDPCDDCDPKQGGADCSGICITK